MKLGDAEGFWGWCQAVGMARPSGCSSGRAGGWGLGPVWSLECHSSLRAGSCSASLSPGPEPSLLETFCPDPQSPAWSAWQGWRLTVSPGCPLCSPSQCHIHFILMAASRTGLGPSLLSADQPLSCLGALPGTLSRAPGRGSNLMPGSEDLVSLSFLAPWPGPKQGNPILPWLSRQPHALRLLIPAEAADIPRGG